MIIGFLRSPRWKTPVMSFLDEYCIVFDNEEENKLEFTKIHHVGLAYISFYLLAFALVLTGLQEDS